MNEAGAGGFAHSIRVLWDEGTATGLDDADLVERFLRRDTGAEVAFAVLVRRHAPMVLRVCRDVIGDPHEAQDAAQAAFLILARNASSIARRDSIAGWLYGTARRVAMRSVRDTARRRRHERRYAEATAERQGAGDGLPGNGRDWSGLYEELDRLPERYRAPIVLCDLEGRTHEQAASALGCPTRTLQTRLYRGRERLRSRLVRRGLLPAAGIAGGLFTTEAGAGFVPASWISATSLAATRLVAGRISAAGLSASVTSLIEGVNRAMFLTQLKWISGFAAFAALSAGVTFGLASGDGKQPTAAEAGKPKSAARKASKSAPAKIQGKLEGIFTDLTGRPIAATLNLSGRATDLAGKPIAGASIFLASTNGIDKDLGQTTTDGDGNYRFSNILLPLRPRTEDTPSQGTLQVYGTAPGFGFAWHGMRTYLPQNRPLGEGINGEDYRLFQDEPIVMDIRFPPAATLGGRIVDEAGRPLPGTEVQLFSCDYLDTKDREEHLNYREFWSIRQASKALRTATTDPDGRFRLEGLPKEAGFWIHVEHPSYAWFRLFAATTDRPETDFTYPLDQSSDTKRPPVFTGDLKITLRENRKVLIQTVFADTREPAPGVKVSASRGTSGSSAYGNSNEQGKLELKLPPGEYDILADPTEGGAECIRTQAVFTVLDAAEQSLEVPANPGAIVVLEAVDAETGKGIPGIMFMRAKPGPSSLGEPVQSRTGYIDNPRSDADGRLRAVVEPGDWQFMPSYLPEKVGYLLYNGRKTAWLEPRKTTTLRFELKKSR
jgi:RNA polymerase sigma factor (sigma-70 family)